MVSKLKLAADVAEKETQIEDLQDLLEEANQRAQRLAAEVGAHEERERLQMKTKHNAEQAKLRAAEREARRESINRLGKGLVQIDANTTQVQITREPGLPARVEVALNMSSDEAQALQYFLSRRREGSAHHDCGILPSGLVFV